MARLRTLSDTYKYLKDMDVETAVTPNALRRMVVPLVFMVSLPYSK